MSSPLPPHPTQPIIVDRNSIQRFRSNEIVQFLLEVAPCNLNDIAKQSFSDEDRVQFAQLIGYSVSGLGDLPYVSDEEYERAIKEGQER